MNDGLLESKRNWGFYCDVWWALSCNGRRWKNMGFKGVSCCDGWWR